MMTKRAALQAVMEAPEAALVAPYIGTAGCHMAGKPACIEPVGYIAEQAAYIEAAHYIVGMAAYIEVRMA